MEIVNAIIEENKDLHIRIEKLEEYGVMISEEIIQCENEYNEVNKIIDSIENIYRFMDTISVSREVLPYKYSDEEVKKNDELEQRINDLKQELNVSKEYIQSIKNYQIRINYMQSKSNFESLCIPRGSETITIPELELYIDMYRLQKKAIELYEKKNFYSFNLSEYEKIVNIFTVENMMEEGHPDKILYGDEAELVCAICRISWEWKYMIALREAFSLYKPKLFSANLDYRKILKDAQKCSILSAWRKDTVFIEEKKELMPIYYEIYRMMLSESEEREISGFALEVLQGR